MLVILTRHHLSRKKLTFNKVVSGKGSESEIQNRYKYEAMSITSVTNGGFCTRFSVIDRKLASSVICDRDLIFQMSFSFANISLCELVCIILSLCHVSGIKAHEPIHCSSFPALKSL